MCLAVLGIERHGLDSQMTEAAELRRRRAEDIFMEGVQDIARAEIHGMFDIPLLIKPLGEWSKSALGMVKSVSLTANGGVDKIAFWSREGALRTLGNTLGLTDPAKDNTALNELIGKRLKEIS